METNLPHAPDALAALADRESKTQHGEYNMDDQPTETATGTPDFHVGMLFLAANSRQQQITALEGLLASLRKLEPPADDQNVIWISGFSSQDLPHAMQPQIFARITQRLIDRANDMFRKYAELFPLEFKQEFKTNA